MCPSHISYHTHIQLPISFIISRKGTHSYDSSCGFFAIVDVAEFLLWFFFSFANPSLQQQMHAKVIILLAFNFNSWMKYSRDDDNNSKNEILKLPH